MTSPSRADLDQYGDEYVRPSPLSSSPPPSNRPDREVSIMHHDLEHKKAELKACREEFAAACGKRRFMEAAASHKRILLLRQDLGSFRPFPLAAQIEANLRQAILLLMCEDVDDTSISLFPNMEDLSRQRRVQGVPHSMAWGVLCAKVGFLFMRLGASAQLDMAKEYLNRSLENLLELRPPPTKHLLPIAQCLADLYDLTARDDTKAEAVVDWLQQKTGQVEFKEIKIGRISRAMKWCTTNGFVFEDYRFEVAAMVHAIKHNVPEQIETMLTFTERIHPSSTLVSRLLLVAAETRSTSMIQLLLDHGAVVDAVDAAGKTGLHHCIYNRSASKDHGSKKDGLKVAGMFLNRDIRLLDKQDHSGKTALHVACEVGYVEMVLFLVGLDANVNLTENNAQTPLYMACERGLRPVVKSLIEKAKDLEVNAKGPGGQTPLTVAVQYAASHAEGKFIVDMLLRHGADPLIEDNTGKTAINYIGGIWASDLKSALKSAKHRSIVTLSKPHDNIGSPFTSSGNTESSQRQSRPASVRSSVFAKIMQPRLKSGASSLISPSRTSLDTTSRSIFSNDYSSRRTSITVPSILEAELDPQTEYSEESSSIAAKNLAIKNKEHPYLPNAQRAGSNEHENISPNKEIIQPNSASSPPRPTSVDQRQQGRSTVPNSDGSETPLPVHIPQNSNASQNRQDPHICSLSNTSSTDSEYDTPSDSEEASFDGEHSPLEPRLYNLTISSQSGRFREYAGGRQGQQTGSFDGASSIPTPPSDHTHGGGGGSKRQNLAQENAGASRGGRLSDAIQAPGSEQKRQVLLACPFAKKDPIAYEHCHKYELKEIKHVKQHLKRCHLIVYCARCRDTFANQVALDRHHRDDDACARSERPVPEGMTLEQHEALKPRTNHKLSLEEQWYFIWDVLFPNRERPPTPYKDEFVNLTEFHRIFRDFRDNQIPALASSVLREMGSTTPILHEQAVAMMRTSLLGFANMLQNAGLVGQTDSSGNNTGQLRSDSLTEGADGSPSQRLSSPEVLYQQNTPDSSGQQLQQHSPGSTRSSADDSYEGLQPIEEVSTTSSGPRQDSVGASTEVSPTFDTAYSTSSHVPAVPAFQPPDWQGSYGFHPAGAGYGPLSGVGAGYESMGFENSMNLMYSPQNLFHVDHSSLEQIIDGMDMDLDVDATQISPQQPMQPHGYFPMQQPVQPQPVAVNPYLTGAEALGPYQQVTTHARVPNTFQANSHQGSNGQQPHWNM